MKYLYKFYWSCGRSGNLEGLFVATEDEVKDAIGSYVYFGEVLGKHSEVYGNIEEGEIVKVNISTEAVEEVAKHLGETWSGLNPLSYITTECEACGDRMRQYEWEVKYRKEFDMEMCFDCYEERMEENNND